MKKKRKVKEKGKDIKERKRPKERKEIPMNYACTRKHR